MAELGGLSGYGSIMQGAGALANAWGSYESSKKANKLLEQQFAYEKQKDAISQNKLAQNNKSLEDAFDLSPLNKKKKNADGADIVDPLALPATV